MTCGTTTPWIRFRIPVIVLFLWIGMNAFSSIPPDGIRAVSDGRPDSAMEKLVSLLLLPSAEAAAPVAVAGPDRTVVKTSLMGATVEMDATASHDDDGDPLSFFWLGPFATGTDAAYPVTIPEGDYTVSLIARDGGATDGRAAVTLSVQPGFTLTPAAKSGKVQLTWTHQPGALRYDIYRAIGGDAFAFTKIAETTSTYSVFIDFTVTDETTYLYAVQAIADGTGDLDADGDVDGADLAVFLANVGRSDCAGGDPCEGDFNGLDNIDAADLAVFGAAFGKAGGISCFSDIVSARPTASLPQPNAAPVIHTAPVVQGTTGIVYNYDVNASDPNGDALAYQLIDPPSGMTIDAASGRIAWTPAAAGTHAVAVMASDGQATDRQDYTLTVVDLPADNLPPVADAGADRTLRLAPGFQTVAVTLDGSGSYDPEGGPLTYLWSGDPDPDDMQKPQLTLGAGRYTFGLVVMDEQGLESAPAQVVVTVSTMDTGGPPQLTVSPSQFTVMEQETLHFSVSATDPDGDVVTLSAAPKIKNAAFVATPGTLASGTVTFTPDYSQQGHYVIAFKALDQWGNAATATARITVVNVNRPPALNVVETATVDEGGLLTIPVTAVDPDGDLLTLHAVPLPANAIFIPATGTITFAPDFEQDDTYVITCSADDGSLLTAKDVTITVNDVPGGTGAEPLVLAVDTPQSPTLDTRTRISGSVNQGSGASGQRLSVALITTLQPSSGRQGQTCDVTLQGQGSGDFVTHFDAKTSQADFGEGITVNALTVNSPTELTANITISRTAAGGTRAVRVTTGNETAIAMVAFSVTAGSSNLTGTLVDAETGNPISGAIVSVQGTTLSTITGADGSYSLQDVPDGNQTLIINAPDHALLTFEIDARVGQALDTGTIAATSTVFDPSAPPSASIHSLLARFALQSQGQLTLEEAKALVIDAILFAGGDEIGAVDAYGGQLNPKVTGDGLISLSDYYVNAYAERLLLDRSTRLMDLLYGLSFAFNWSKGAPPTLNEWISALQKVVDAAWQYPNDPDARLPILLFNTSNALNPDPPRISAAMHLNDFKAFLFVTSFLTGHEMFAVEGVGAPFGIGNNPIGTNENRASVVMLAMVEESSFTSPAAHDSPGDPSNFSYYLSENFDNTTTDFMDVYLSGGMLAAQVPQLWQAYDTESRLKGTLTQKFGYLVGEKYLQSICAPPVPQEAVVFDQGTPYQSVGIRFKRSNTDPGAIFDNTPDSGTVGNRRYGYQLYRQQYLRGGVTLVPVADRPWYTDDPDTLLLIDPRPPAGVNHYRVVFLHGDIDVDFTQLFIQQNLSSADLLRWAGHVIGTGTGNTDDVPLASFSSLLHKSTTFISRLSEDSISIAVPDAIVSDDNPVVDLVVHPTTGKIYLGDREYDEIVEVNPLFSSKRSLVAKTGFALPGQTGLAVTPSGDLYTDNAASDHAYGGRIFRFPPSGGKAYAGQVNYFSQLLGRANPVSVIALAADGLGDIYVADNYDRQIKKLPMAQALDEGWPTDRIVGHGIGAELPGGFSSFTDMEFSGGDLYVSSGDTIYRWLAAGGGMTHYAEIPQAHFAGLGVDSRNQLYVACQGVGSVGENTGFIMVLPEDTVIMDESTASRYKFMKNMTFPGEVEISADGKSIVYTSGGRAKAQYFGISGQLVDDHGRPMDTTGVPTYVKAYSDLGESLWYQADENGIFSIMGLLAPGQRFHGGSSKFITLAIKSGGYTEERQVTLASQGQTLLDVTHNSYEIVIDPGAIKAASGLQYTVSYEIFERGTRLDVTGDVFAQGMVRLSVGNENLIQITDSAAGQFTIQTLAEPDSYGTYAALSLVEPSTGITLSYNTVSVYGQRFSLDVKTSPCHLVPDPSGGTIYECSDVDDEITLARGRVKDFNAEVFDAAGNRISDLPALVAAGYAFEYSSTSTHAVAPPLVISEVSPGSVNVQIPTAAKEGCSYALQWLLKRTSDGSTVARSAAVTIWVRDFSISNEIILDNDPPAAGESVTYVIKLTNYAENSISGDFTSTIPDVLDIVLTSSNVNTGGQTVSGTLSIDGDAEAIVSIYCRVNTGDYAAVVNTATLTIGDSEKTDSAAFGASTTLARSGDATMQVRGVTQGWQLSECTPSAADPFKYADPLASSRCYDPPPATGEPFMACLRYDASTGDCRMPEICDDSSAIKTVALDETIVTLYGTTRVPIEVEIAQGTNSDAITFSADIDSTHVAFDPPVALIEKQGAVGRATTTLVVSDLWQDATVDRDSPPSKLTVSATTQSHGSATLDVEIVDNFQILKNIYLKDTELYRRGDYGYSEDLENLSTGALGKAWINVSGSLIRDNTMICTNYTAHILKKFNLYRSLPGTLWWFNGLDYGPLQTSYDWDNICDKNAGTHHAVSLYPAGYFLTEEDRVLDGWWNQQPMVWRYPDWESYFSYTIWFRTPGAREMGLNYPNSVWFDPEHGYPGENQVIGALKTKSNYRFELEDYEAIELLIPEYTSVIIGSPVTFVVTDREGRKSGKDGSGIVYDEIPGLGLRVTQFPKDTGDPIYILNHIMRDFDLTLHPTETGTASLAALRILPDGTARREIYQNFPIVPGQPVHYAPQPDSPATPVITLGDGSAKTADFIASVFVVTQIDPVGNASIDPEFTVISARFSKPVPEESLDDQAFRLIDVTNGTTVFCSIAYDAEKRMVTITPHEALSSNTEYAVRIILDQVPLIDDQIGDYKYEWHFYTN